MKDDFVDRMSNPNWGTGSGHSISYGDVQVEAYCPLIPPWTYRKNASISGALGSLSNSTVAVCPQNVELYVPGRQLLIVGIGVKTITDRCPKCCQGDGKHLDNYTTDRACNGVGSLPSATTIILY
jgi:hypothetical protein